MKKINTCMLSISFMMVSMSASGAELINCFSGMTNTGDDISRGFYVESYSGFTLDRVYLFLIATQPGEGHYTLTARTDNYAGSVLGVAEASFEFSGNADPVPVIFDFQRALVTTAQRVTFALEQQSGPGTLYSVAAKEGCPVIQTEDTTPPLSEFRGTGITAIFTGADEPLMASLAMLETPSSGGNASGISTISGWVCEAERVELLIDGSTLVEAAYGTPRADTLGACGDTDNGFGLLVNYGILGDGVHLVSLLADGVEVDSSTFVVTTLGAPFVSGLSGQFELMDFPAAGQQVTLEWTESQQGFVIVGVDP